MTLGVSNDDSGNSHGTTEPKTSTDRNRRAQPQLPLATGAPKRNAGRMELINPLRTGGDRAVDHTSLGVQ